MSDTPTTHESILRKLFFDYFGVEAESVNPLNPHASTRRYFVLEREEDKAIGVYGPSIRENKAFFHIQKHFQQQGIRVPLLYKADDTGNYYLQEYSGSIDLFSYLETTTNKLDVLKKSIQMLVDVKQKGSAGFDYSLCYPYSSFGMDEVKRGFRALQCKYFFHKGIDLEENFFQNDIKIIEKLIREVPKADYGFMHRDFHTRNLLLGNDSKLVLIDFQGGRYGPRYYDLASLIYSAESPYAHEYKDELIDFYRKIYNDDGEIKDFMKYFLIIALVRLIHTLGVYGSLGLEKKDDFFSKNIPTAEDYLKEVLFILESEYDISFKGLKTCFKES